MSAGLNPSLSRKANTNTGKHREEETKEKPRQEEEIPPTQEEKRNINI